MQISAKKLADMLGGIIEGNGDVLVSKASKIEEAESGSITFLANPKYEEFVYTTEASILLVSKSFAPKENIKPTLVRVDDVYQSVSLLLSQFGNQAKKSGISEQAIIGKKNTIDPTVYEGHFTVIGNEVNIGAGSQIDSQVSIGDKVKIGKNVRIYPGVRIYKECEVGDNCVLHSNVIVGSDGFGFAPTSDGSYKKIPQIGNVIIEENVEIGANTTIDRATMGSTIIRQGVKLDNLIMVGHNAEIGANTVIAAQTGVAGSTTLGANCVIGGQVGFAGHLKIANGTKIQAQSGLNKSITEEGTSLYGSPALNYRDFLKCYSIFRKLPKLQDRLGNLEKKQS